MKPEIHPPERLLTIKEVAQIQQTCERTIRRRIASGELPAIRDGRLIRVRPRDLRVYQLQRLLSGGVM
jgi:excisionase family DNA binding protein